jgi:hypothetical protein
MSLTDNGGGNFDPYSGGGLADGPYPRHPETFSNELAKQFDIARSSLNYPGRSAPPQPGPTTTNEDGRDIKSGSGL